MSEKNELLPANEEKERNEEIFRELDMAVDEVFKEWQKKHPEVKVASSSIKDPSQFKLIAMATHQNIMDEEEAGVRKFRQTKYVFKFQDGGEIVKFWINGERGLAEALILAQADMVRSGRCFEVESFTSEDTENTKLIDLEPDSEG